MKKNIIIIFLLLLIVILSLPISNTQSLKPADDINIPSYDIAINDFKIDNASSEYPLINYQGVTYLPLTWDYSKDLGLETSWDEETGLHITNLNILSLDYENDKNINAKESNNEEQIYQMLENNYDDADTNLEKSHLDAKMPILVYHHITIDPSTWDGITISPQKFREDILYLKALGYNSIHFKDYFNALENGTSLPENPIIITFDDGYRSNYVFAYPILKELDMKATISIIGWSVGREYHMDNETPIKPHFTWEEGTEMYDSGLIDIQHHSYDLHNLGDSISAGEGVSKLLDESTEDYLIRLTNDTNKLTNLIEEKIGNEVNIYTYPFGIYNEISEKVLKDLGFKVSLSIYDGIADLEDGHYLLERINMPSNVSSVELMKKILELDGRIEDIPFEDIQDQAERIEKLESSIIK